MHFEYSQDEMAKEILKKAKIRNGIKDVISALLVICYVVAIKVVISENKILFVTSIAFIFVCLVLIVILRKINIKYLFEVINAGYPEGLLNLSIYSYEFFSKPSILKKLFSALIERYVVTTLNNIATAYYQMGDIENTLKVVNYLENEYKVKNKKTKHFKDLITINLKTAIAFSNNDIDEFKKQNIKLKEILKSFPEKNVYKFLIKLNLREAFLDNNLDEVNKLCDELNKSNLLSDKVLSAHFKAQILEKNKKEGWQEYYKYVADNGNTLAIAKKAREKLGIKNY